MKKLNIKVIVLILLMLGGFILWFYNKNSTKITFNSEDPRISSIRINAPGTYGILTEDKNKINKIIKFLNSVSYYSGSDLELPSKDPDAMVFITDKEENVIDKISFYGDVVIYKKKKYKAPLFIYYRLERLCKSLGEK